MLRRNRVRRGPRRARPGRADRVRRARPPAPQARPAPEWAGRARRVPRVRGRPAARVRAVPRGRRGRGARVASRGRAAPRACQVSPDRPARARRRTPRPTRPPPRTARPTARPRARAARRRARFCWDFEEGKLPTGWTPYRNEFATGSLLVDGTRAHRGMYALHEGLLGQQGGPGRRPQAHDALHLASGLRARAVGARVRLHDARDAHVAPGTSTRVPAAGRRRDVGHQYAELVRGRDVVRRTSASGTRPSRPARPNSCRSPTRRASSTAGRASNGSRRAERRRDRGRRAARVGQRHRARLAHDAGRAHGRRPTHAREGPSFTVLESGIYLYQGLSTVTNWWNDDLAVGKQRMAATDGRLLDLDAREQALVRDVGELDDVLAAPTW